MTRNRSLYHIPYHHQHDAICIASLVKDIFAGRREDVAKYNLYNKEILIYFTLVTINVLPVSSPVFKLESIIIIIILLPELMHK